MGFWKNGVDLIVISHRGYWRIPEEKNSSSAFEQSFKLGFGVETDFRDLNGKLVVSHDTPKTGAMDADAFFSQYSAFKPAEFPLALNIKSDGLGDLLSVLLKKHSINNYFVFDMSIPDTLGYIQKGIRFFTRHSEYEKDPAFYAEADGVWMDCFLSDWIDEGAVKRHLDAGKKVCLVSPELHKRPHESWWKGFAGTAVSRSRDVMLCTDFPEQAREVFHAD